MRYIRAPITVTSVNTPPQEDDDLPSAPLECDGELLGLADIAGQLEDPENAEKTQPPDDQQGLGPGEEHTQVRRDDGQQIHDPEETPGVVPRVSHRDEPQDVLDGEENGEHPFHHPQLGAKAGPDPRHALQHHRHQAEDDGNQEGNIEGFAGGGIGLEYYLVEPGSPTDGGWRFRGHALSSADHGRRDTVAANCNRFMISLPWRSGGG
jgi:hypothetical protein